MEQIISIKKDEDYYIPKDKESNNLKPRGNFIIFLQMMNNCHDSGIIANYIKNLEINSYAHVPKREKQQKYAKAKRRTHKIYEDIKIKNDLEKQVKQYTEQMGFYAAMIHFLLSSNKALSAEELMQSRLFYDIKYTINGDNTIVNITPYYIGRYIHLDFHETNTTEKELHRFIAILNQMSEFYLNKLNYAFLLNISEPYDETKP